MGSVDVLVNNATSNCWSSFEECPDDIMEKVFNVNYTIPKFNLRMKRAFERANGCHYLCYQYVEEIKIISGKILHSIDEWYIHGSKRHSLLIFEQKRKGSHEHYHVRDLKKICFLFQEKRRLYEQLNLVCKRTFGNGNDKIINLSRKKNTHWHSLDVRLIKI